MPKVSGINVVLVMAFGSLVFVLLFIFLQRQIMRFLMKSHIKPHTPVGHNAPKALKERITSLLSEQYYSRREPRLLSHDDVRLQKRDLNYPYRMQALDAIQDHNIVSPDLVSCHSTRTGSSCRNWLLALRESQSPITSSHRSLIDRLLEGYDNARHGTGVFGEAEFLRYKEDLTKLAAIVKLNSSTSSIRQQLKP